MVTMKAILIVGDRFSGFANQGSVRCFSEIARALEDDVARLDGAVLTLGQGLSGEQVDALLRRAEALGVRDRLRFDRVEKCGKRHVHKERAENSLVTLPRRLDDDRFAADVYIDETSELLNDHFNSRHIPGMVLIEATRQMCLALTEEYFTDADDAGRAFLWTGLHTRFLDFAFPAPLTVEARVVERSVAAKKTSFRVDVQLFQYDTVVAASDVGFETRSRAAVERREATRASAVADVSAAAALAR
jgi:hypothetical protein